MNLRKDHSHAMLCLKNCAHPNRECACAYSMSGEARVFMGRWDRVLTLCPAARAPHARSLAVSSFAYNCRLCIMSCLQRQPLSAMDVSARTTMKGAAKCDELCELQNSVNQQGLERILCSRDTPESIPTTVPMCESSTVCVVRLHLIRLRVGVCQRDCG